MLKALHNNDTQIKPFIAVKDWSLSNTTNYDLILMEHSGSPGLPVAIEYLEYQVNTPVTASSCNLAQESQTDDLVGFRDGLKLSGIFYPDSDPQNIDGTYQRMVYTQVSNMFYNSYRDPTKMWGMENIDFELSQTKRFISDKFKMYSIPQINFGETIIANSIVLLDNTTDNDYVITDDGNCNLFAGTNVFSNQQELGEFVNVILEGGSDNCDTYNTISPPNTPVLSLIYNLCVPSITLDWNINDWPVTSYIIEKSYDGIDYFVYQSLNGGLNSYVDTNVTYSNSYWYQIYATNIFGSSSMSNTGSVFCNIVTWDNDPDVWDMPWKCSSFPTWDGTYSWNLDPSIWDSSTIWPPITVPPS